jgi:ribosomal 50S subunit-recycling heat shock protein
MCEDCGCGHTDPSGEVTHFYGRPMVAVVKLAEAIKNGDKIKVEGATTEFTMTVQGMRNEQEQEIEEAAAGELVAFKTPEVARPGDKIWLTMREVESE